MKTAIVYLAVTLLTCGFGLIYEHFSFGVISLNMLFAFVIPLVMGCIPFSVYAIVSVVRQGSLQKYVERYSSDSTQLTPPGYAYGTPLALCFYHAAVAAFTVGSLFKGALDIYGTTSGLTPVYVFGGCALLAASLCLFLLRKVKNSA